MHFSLYRVDHELLDPRTTGLGSLERGQSARHLPLLPFLLTSTRRAVLKTQDRSGKSLEGSIEPDIAGSNTNSFH